jgi:fructosamine-3-kinase
MILNTEAPIFSLKADVPMSKEDILLLLAIGPTEIEQKMCEQHVLCEQLFADKIKTIEFVDKGTFHHLFKITIRDNKEYFVKTSKLRSPYRSYHFYIDRWVKEQEVHLDCSMPTIINIDCERNGINYDYVVMEKAEQYTLDSLKHDRNSYRQWIEKLGESLALIHRVPVNKAGLINGRILYEKNLCEGVQTSWKSYVLINLKTHLEYCVSHNIFDHKIQSEIEQIFFHYQFLFDKEENYLLHGDLNDHNVFIRDHGLTLIDWEDALSGDPIFDIAVWGTFINHHENLDAFLNGYQKISSLPDDFMLRYWIYYLRFVLVKTVVRHRFDYYKTDKIPAIDRILLPLLYFRKLCHLKD